MASTTASPPLRDADHIPEIVRLLTKDIDGGLPAIDLGNFFRIALQTALEEGSVAIDQIYAHAKATGKSRDFKRMSRHYRSNGDSEEDGVRACLRVLLTQLEHVGLLRKQDGVWVKTDKLVRNVPFYISKYPHRWITVTLASPSEEDAVRVADMANHRVEDGAATDLAVKLQPGREGWRLKTKTRPWPNGIDPSRVERIVASVRDYGFVNHPAFYVLRDIHGRVLGGRHRLAAVLRLREEGLVGPDWSWPEHPPIEVENDAETVRYAYEANRSDAWSQIEEDALRAKMEGSDETLLELALQKRRRLLIWDALRAEDKPGATLNYSVMSQRLFGTEASRHQVASVYREMSANCILSNLRTTEEGRPRDEDAWQRTSAAWKGDPQASVRAIAEKAGVGKSMAHDVHEELVTAGEIPPKPWQPGKAILCTYEHFVQHGPCITEEARDALGGGYSTVPTHVEELAKHGWLRSTGEKPARSGTPALLYEVVPEEERPAAALAWQQTKKRYVQSATAESPSTTVPANRTVLTTQQGVSVEEKQGNHTTTVAALDQPKADNVTAPTTTSASVSESQAKHESNSPPDRTFVLNLAQQLPVEDQEWLCSQLKAQRVSA